MAMLLDGYRQKDKVKGAKKDASMQRILTSQGGDSHMGL